MSDMRHAITFDVIDTVSMFELRKRLMSDMREKILLDVIDTVSK